MKRAKIPIKRTLLAALAAAGILATASCIKEGDFEALKHPIHVQGQLDPHLGLPVAYGELNFNDVITKWAQKDETVNSFIDSTSEVLTLVYSGSVSDSLQPMKNMHKSAEPKAVAGPRGGVKSKDGDEGSLLSVDTTFYSGVVPIDFFDNAEWEELIEDKNLQMSHLWITLSVNALGEYQSSSLEQMINPYVSAVFDSIVIKYTGYDGTEYTLRNEDLEVPPFNIIDITQGTHHVFDSIDLAPFINVFPKEIEASFRMRINVSSRVISDGVLDTFDVDGMYFMQMIDTLKMTKLHYNINADFAVPLSLQLKHLTINPPPLDMGSGGIGFSLDSLFKKFHDSLNVDLKEAVVQLRFDNGIPFDFDLQQVSFLDADSNHLMDLDIDTGFIASSPTILTNHAGVYQSHGSTRSTVRISITEAQLEELKEARYISLKLHFNTAQKQKVSVKREDFLRIKVYLQVWPNISFDIPVIKNGILK